MSLLACIVQPVIPCMLTINWQRYTIWNSKSPAMILPSKPFVPAAAIEQSILEKHGLLDGFPCWQLPDTFRCVADGCAGQKECPACACPYPKNCVPPRFHCMIACRAEPEPAESKP